MSVKFPILASLLLLLTLASQQTPHVAADESVTVTILHNSEASSMLLNAGDGLEDYGGVARFETLVEIERAKASTTPNDVAIVLSAGNSLEVGPDLEASIDKGAPYYDAVAMRAIGYDAALLGDQDFGLGPDVLANFLCGIVMPGGGTELPACGLTGRSAFPFLAANLDFSAEAELQEFVDAGGIAGSTIVTKGQHRIGVVGVTNPDLAFIASPRDVTVLTNTARGAQTQIDALEAQGVDKIVVLAQMPSMDELVALTESLSGVDVVVAGGNGALQATGSTALVPDDAYDPAFRYPVYVTSADGSNVPIVTTAGGYRYLGRLTVEFDDDGNIVWVDPGSGPIRVAGAGIEGGVAADAILQGAVDAPVQAFLDSLASTDIATSQVALDGRTDVIRTRETNLGNLMADATLWQARELAGEFGVQAPDVAILNAGGMRLNRLSPAGDLSRLGTYEIAPFASFISVVENVSPETLKLLVENSLSKLSQLDGRFGQVAGISVTYDPAGEALAFDNNGTRLNEGSRVLSIRLDDGTYVVQNGAVVQGAPDVAVATIDFMAGGGDQYPFSGDFTTLGVSYQQALESYVVEALGGVIGAAQYPEGGAGRIVAQ